MKLLILFVFFCGAMAQTEEEDLGKETDLKNNGPRKMFRNSYYMFFSTPTTWVGAQFQCLANGGHLAVINTKEEDDFVKELSGGKPSWIGLSDAQEAYYWFWINSETLRYSNWCPGEPNNWYGRERCVGINYSGKKCWNDYQCNVLLAYVCEMK